MREFFSLFDFRYIVGGQQLWLYLYMLVYLVYAFTTGLEDSLLAASILIFALAPLKPSFLMFVFYLLWEYVTVFSFGVTAVMVMQLMMVAKMIIQREKIKLPKGKIARKSLSLQTGLLLYIIIMGVASFLISGNTTGLSYIFKVLVTFYAIAYLYNAKSYNNLIRAILQVLMFSALIGTIYGFYHDTAIERWISGMGDTVTQLYGTLGTTRMAFFYLTSVAYFLYYVKNVSIRMGGIFLFTVLTLMTVSLSAIGLYVIIMGIYMFSKGSMMKMLKWGGALILVVVLTFPVWSKSDFVAPIIYRIEFSTDAYEAGDIDAATTGRSDIQNAYMNNIEGSNLFTIMVGNARTAMSVANMDMNTHNTFLDIIFYFGIVGLVLLVYYQVEKLLLLRGQPYFYPLLTLKAILLIGSSTVSVMSATYYMVLIFI